MRSTCLAVVLLAVAAAPAAAQPRLSAADPGPEARARLQLGTVLYEQGRFEEAAAHFERAHEISAHPAMIYNAFVAYRRADRARDALRALDAYLATDAPSAEERADLEAQRGPLAELVAALPPEEASPEPEPDPDTTDADAAAEAPVESPTARAGPDLLGPVVLLGVGAAALVASAVTGGLTAARDASLQDRCTDGACPADVAADIDEGRTLALVTDVLWATGAAVAVAGLVWLIVAVADGGGAADAATRPTEVRF